MTGVHRPGPRVQMVHTVGYWCRVTAWPTDLSREIDLGSYQAKTPRLVVRWLRRQMDRLANALDPRPGVGWAQGEAADGLRRLPDTVPENLPDPGGTLREWGCDIPAQERVMDGLVKNLPFFMTVNDHTAYYMLSAEPLVAFHPAEWRTRERPLVRSRDGYRTPSWH